MEFKLNDKVEMILSKEVHGMITAICIRPGGTTYEVMWIHNGEMKEGWVSASFITLLKEEKGELGFKK